MGTKVCSNGLVHMTKMAITLIYGNAPLECLLQNQGLWSWCVAFGDVGPIKCLLKVDLDLLHAKVKFAS